MKGPTYLLPGFLMAVLVLGLVPNSFSQVRDSVRGVDTITRTHSTMGISYPEGPALSIKFQGTHRLPWSSGEAKVERKKGMTEIEIERDEMKPATLFGGDFATYVLWMVSPEGHVDNAGEFILEGNRSKLNVSTPLQTFGMTITAEPHFLVDSPSRFVVMENTRPTQPISGQMIETATIKYHGFEGKYHFLRESLTSTSESEEEVRSDLEQARIAVSLAESAGAKKFAAQELAKARNALERIINFLGSVLKACATTWPGAG